MRFMRGPSLAIAFLTYRLSRSTSTFFSVLWKLALSIADWRSLPTVAATRFFVKSRVLRAFSTLWPLMRSNTNRAFCGDTRMNRACARNSISCLFAIPKFLKLRLRRGRRRRSRSSWNSCWTSRSFGCRLHRVSLEGAREAEFTELVADHVFGHIHENELLPVVNRNRVSNHLGDDRRASRPGPQYFLLITRIHAFNFCGQMRVDERPFFCRTCHKVSSQFSVPGFERTEPGFWCFCNVDTLKTCRALPFFPAADDERIGSLVVTGLVSTSGLPPRRYGMPSARGLSFTTTMRMVNRVHCHAAIMWALS